MTKVLKGTFAADGSTDTFVCDQFTALVGNSDGETFGGGTVTFQYSHDGETFTSDPDTLTATGVKTSESFAGGLVVKLVLSGSTSPDLNYSVKYV